MDRFTSLIGITRPRFWLYLAGPFLVGYAIAIDTWSDFLHFQFWLYLGYFGVIANTLLYGINDIFDADTDQFNVKKGTYETHYTAENGTITRYSVIVAGLLSLSAVWWLNSFFQQLLLGLFIALAVGYSLPPLRFKARPVIDSASNVLYVMPGFFGYLLGGGESIPVSIVIAATTWTMAMHLYSAIPDILADKKAHLQTTAVKLGETRSLWLCAALWVITAGIVTFQGYLLPLALLLWIYPVSMVWMLHSQKNVLFRLYEIFPWLNASFGAAIFFFIISQKPL